MVKDIMGEGNGSPDTEEGSIKPQDGEERKAPPVLVRSKEELLGSRPDAADLSHDPAAVVQGMVEAAEAARRFTSFPNEASTTHPTGQVERKLNVVGKRGLSEAEIEALDDKRKTEIEEGRRTGRIGGLEFREVITPKGEHQFFLKDPQTGQEVSMLPGRAFGAENLAHEHFDPLLGATLAQKIDEVSRQMFGYEFSRGEGFENQAVRTELERIIVDATLGNSAERDALMDYAKYRAGLDRVFRAWNGARLAGNDKEAIAKFWAAWSINWGGPVRTALEASIPGLTQAENYIETQLVPPNIGKPYFQIRDEKIARLQLKTWLMNTHGINAVNADIAILAAERILKIDIDTHRQFGHRSVAEKQGLYFMPNAPTPKDQQEEGKKFIQSWSGFLANVFGLGKK